MSRLARMTLLSGILAATFAAPTASFAQATITFTPGCATGGFVDRGPTYIEAGFTLTSPDLASWCADAPHYGGPAAFLNYGGTSGQLTKVGGGTFTANSIDLAHVYNGSFGTQSFTFTGNLFGGGAVFETFTIAAQSGTPSFQTFNFAPTFTNLTSLDLATQDPSYYQFTNVKLDAVTATPEPASLVLMATGLFGVAAVRRKRRS